MNGRQIALAAAAAGAWLAFRAARKAKECDLRGKTVLITGASRGLGLVLARQLLREGANLAICARDPTELSRAYVELERQGGNVLALPCNVADQTQVQDLVATIHEHFGPIDVLINNAGTIHVGPITSMTLTDFQDAMQTNFWASLYTILAVLPDMRQRRAGRIVNITSIGGKVSLPHLLPYSASKFALVGLSEGLRAELNKEGISVTTVCPGLMRTGSPRNALFKGDHRAEYAWFDISDSLPFLSMSAERAARQIIDACKQGTAEVVLSLPAKCAVTFHGLFPGLTADLLSVVHRCLPDASTNRQGVLGKASESPWAPSWLTALSDQAAEKNNEMTPEERQEAEGQTFSRANP